MRCHDFTRKITVGTLCTLLSGVINGARQQVGRAMRSAALLALAREGKKPVDIHARVDQIKDVAANQRMSVAAEYEM